MNARINAIDLISKWHYYDVWLWWYKFSNFNEMRVNLGGASGGQPEWCRRSSDRYQGIITPSQQLPCITQILLEREVCRLLSWFRALPEHYLHLNLGVPHFKWYASWSSCLGWASETPSVIPWALTGQACASRTSIYFLVKPLDKDFLLFWQREPRSSQTLGGNAMQQFQTLSPRPSFLSLRLFIRSSFIIQTTGTFFSNFLIPKLGAWFRCDYSLIIFPLQMVALGTLKTHHESDTFGRRAGSPTTSRNTLKLCQSVFFGDSFHRRSNLDAFLNQCGYRGASRRQNIHH